MYPILMQNFLNIFNLCLAKSTVAEQTGKANCICMRRRGCVWGGVGGCIICPVSTMDVYKLVISNFMIIFRNCTHNYNSLQPGSKCFDYIILTLRHQPYVWLI